MSFVERANGVRKRIPYWYWLAYDVAALPLMVWGIASSWWYAPVFVMYVVAVFFDVNEAFVKWERWRRAS